jgi:hypothetical protein
LLTEDYATYVGLTCAELKCQRFLKLASGAPGTDLVYGRPCEFRYGNVLAMIDGAVTDHVIAVVL